MEDITLRDTLKLAVQTEKIAAKLYDRFARRFSGQGKVGEVFARLARDEGEHESFFQTILDGIPADEQDASRYDRDSYLRAVSISGFFRNGAFEKMTSVETPVDALEKALEFERSTLLFYSAIRDELGASPALDELIAAEKSHVVTLTRVLVADAKFRGLADLW